MIGTLQWISNPATLYVTYAESSLSQFSSQSTEVHLKRNVKILRYMNKLPEKSYVVGTNLQIDNSEYEEVIPDFGNQYLDFVEQVDALLPGPRLKQLTITIFVK